MRKGKRYLWSLALVAAMFCLVVAHDVYQKKYMGYWIRPYISWVLSEKVDLAKVTKPVHVMILLVDHFEPTTMTNMRAWRERYQDLSMRHRDADGRHFQYTWFYFADGFKDDIFEEIVALSKMGLGEIELQLHHKDDTPETFREKIRAAKKAFRKGGALFTTENKEAFAYVAGNWALDNSWSKKGKNYSGVNSELKILKEEGCFADFTFPSVNEAQPAMVNKIYYAFDDPVRPKSYDRGIAMEKLVTEKHDQEGLVIFEGPLFINWKDWRHVFYPSIDDGQILAGNPPIESRVDAWIDAAIHVKGKPDWIFVKMFTHGATPKNQDVLFNGDLDRALSLLETRYNDGKTFILHYVTAREAYNIAKAAEHGLEGNPDRYRDYLVKRYQNSPAAEETHGN